MKTVGRKVDICYWFVVLFIPLVERLMPLLGMYNLYAGWCAVMCHTCTKNLYTRGVYAIMDGVSLLKT
jgi:hypothetical protein